MNQIARYANTVGVIQDGVNLQQVSEKITSITKECEKAWQAIKLFNYKSDDLLESMKQCRGRFIVIDNADILIDDEVRRFINFEFSNQYMLFLRNCDGLNVSDKSFKVLKLDNNRITLEEELLYEIFMDRRYRSRISLMGECWYKDCCVWQSVDLFEDAVKKLDKMLK